MCMLLPCICICACHAWQNTCTYEQGKWRPVGARDSAHNGTVSSTVGRSAAQASSNRCAVSGFLPASRSTEAKIPARRLNKKLLMKPTTWKLGRKESVPAAPWKNTSPCTLCRCLQFHRTCSWVSGTPLAFPVDPEVNMINATPSAAAADSPDEKGTLPTTDALQAGTVAPSSDNSTQCSA